MASIARRPLAVLLALAATSGATPLTPPVVEDVAALAADDECQASLEGPDREQCALNALQRRGLRLTKTQAEDEAVLGTSVDSSAGDNETLDLRARGPPPTALAYKGMAWPKMTVAGATESHIFAIGDWGGMDGSLPPIEGRPRLIAYSGGHTGGPHVFPRNRWDKGHATEICNHDEMVSCFNGAACPSACGFVPGIDTQPQQLVANAFRARAAKSNPAYILNVGDNFYWGGIEQTCGAVPMGTVGSTARHQFSNVFESMYNGGGLSGKPWLSVLGNHDYGGRQFNNGWDQQISYTWATSRWVLPAPYWSQHVDYPDAGFSVDLYFLDSNFMDAFGKDEDPEHNICGAMHNPPDASCAKVGGPASLETCQGWFQSLWAEQKVWLEAKLAASTADWQIIVTHFPCGHEQGWYQSLHQSLGLDLLVTGHRHDQELWDGKQMGGLTCFVTGGGGGITSEATPNPMDKTHWYGEGQYGFFDLTISKASIKLESINYDGTVLKTATVLPKAKR